ncbi:hypothetical protein QBC41DRAFT_106544 [Cercophora samala]|uniref:Outer spore wall protein RRT8 n=1 Tax=Cercophora samala TaxID=330535 RepID=A0AA39ZEL7_9PEZI|nr:hypothetical protein QBC41DRAFT_106544 [Cercophora samala]
MPNRLVDQAQEVAKEDIDKYKALLNDAAKSRSYLYPIKGILYFLSHRELWKPLASKLVPYLGLYASVIGPMFFFTYLPQLAVMVFVNGPLAVFTTILLVLNESAAVVSILSRSFLLQDALLDTFDGTLIAKNKTEIVANGREVNSRGDSIQKLGKALKKPFSRFSVKELVRYFMYLPLNFIPIIGTVAFIVIRGRARGNSVHDRYFQLKGWSASRKSEWLSKHKGPYTGITHNLRFVWLTMTYATSFGTAATLLEMIPVASIVFSFTNTVGAALWAADIEAKDTEMTKATAPELREAAKKVE